MIKTLKERVREKMASGITDFRKVFDAITVGHPRNRKWPSFKTVRRYVREFQNEFRPSPEDQDVTGVEPSTKDAVIDTPTEAKTKRTIMIRCDLPNLLTLLSQEVVPINTAMQMGLGAALERLAKRGRVLNDPELEKCLDQLCL